MDRLILVLLCLFAAAATGTQSTTTAANNASHTHVFRAHAHLQGRPSIVPLRRSPTEARHTVVFAVRQRNTDALEEPQR